MFLDSAILGILAAGPRHGYAIVKTLGDALHGISAVNPGQVYATLARLARDGLIASAPPPRGDAAAPPPRAGTRAARRRRFALAPQGRRELRRWLDRPLGPVPRADPFADELAARVLGGDATAIARLLAARRARSAALLAGLPADDAAAPPHLRAARRHLLAELAWLARAARLLAAPSRSCARTFD